MLLSPSSTGPYAPQSGDDFIYYEASSNNGGIYYLNSGVISSSNISINFYYHAYGSDISYLKLESFDGAVWTERWAVNGQQHTDDEDSWNSVSLDLSSHTVTQLRFVTSNSGFRADVALDNINVVSNIPENTTYLWTTDATNGNSGWSHTDSIDISISSACNTSHNGTYTLTVTDAIGCVASDNVNIIVNPCTEYSSGGSISGAETICEGFNPIDISSNSLPSGGSGGLTSYQWQYSSDNSNWINVNGVTSESYDLNTISSTTFYRRGRIQM